MNKEKIKDFFVRFKKGIVSAGICCLAIAIVCAVAVSTKTNETKIVSEEVVNTSTQTSLSFVSPMNNATILKDFSNTALKYNATLKQWESHKAVDFTSESTDVYAVCDGEIVSVKTSYLYGTVITIKHNNNLQTVYGSLDENVLVNVGDKVKQGQLIGYASTSAKKESSDGVHLHFEVLQNEIKVDPNIYLMSSDK